jgi:hypothetical protein
MIKLEFGKVLALVGKTNVGWVIDLFPGINWVYHWIIIHI